MHNPLPLPIPLAPVCFAIMLAGALEAQSLWTVDITGATGFTTIQAAMLVAQPVATAHGSSGWLDSAY